MNLLINILNTKSTRAIDNQAKSSLYSGNSFVKFVRSGILMLIPSSAWITATTVTPPTTNG